MGFPAAQRFECLNSLGSVMSPIPISATQIFFQIYMYNIQHIWLLDAYTFEKQNNNNNKEKSSVWVWTWVHLDCHTSSITY